MWLGSVKYMGAALLKSQGLQGAQQSNESQHYHPSCPPQFVHLVAVRSTVSTFYLCVNENVGRGGVLLLLRGVDEQSPSGSVSDVVTQEDNVVWTRGSEARFRNLHLSL